MSNSNHPIDYPSSSHLTSQSEASSTSHSLTDEAHPKTPSSSHPGTFEYFVPTHIRRNTFPARMTNFENGDRGGPVAGSGAGAGMGAINEFGNGIIGPAGHSRGVGTHGRYTLGGFDDDPGLNGHGGEKPEGGIGTNGLAALGLGKNQMYEGSMSEVSMGETDMTGSTMTDGTIKVRGDAGGVGMGDGVDADEDGTVGRSAGKEGARGIARGVGKEKRMLEDGRDGLSRSMRDGEGYSETTSNTSTTTSSSNASATNSLKRGRPRTRSILPMFSADWQRTDADQDRDSSSKKSRRTQSGSAIGEGTHTPIERTQPMAIPKANCEASGYPWESHSIKTLGMTPMTGRPVENILETSGLKLLEQAAAAMMSRSYASRISHQGQLETLLAAPDNKTFTALGNVVISNRMASPRISPSAYSPASATSDAINARTQGTSFVARGKQPMVSSPSREDIRRRISTEGIGAHRKPLRSKSSLSNMAVSSDRNATSPPPRPASSLSHRTPPPPSNNPPGHSRHRARWSVGSSRGTPQPSSEVRFPMKRRLTGKSTPSTAGQDTSVLIRPKMPQAGATTSLDGMLGLALRTSPQPSPRAVSNSSVASLPDDRLATEGTDPFEADKKAQKASTLLKSIQDHDMEHMANLAVHGDYFSPDHGQDQTGPAPGTTARGRLQRAGSLGSVRNSLGKALSVDNQSKQDASSSYSRLGLMTPLKTIRRLRLRREGSQGGIFPIASNALEQPVSNSRSTSDNGHFVYTRPDGTRREITEQDHPFHYNYLVRRNSKSQSRDISDRPIRGPRRNSERSISDQEDFAAWRGSRSGSPRPVSKRPPPSAFRGSPCLSSRSNGVAQPIEVARPMFRSAQTTAGILSTSAKSDHPFSLGTPGSGMPGPTESPATYEQSPPHLRDVSRSASFDSRSAYEAVKGKDGYVSFEDVAGLGKRAGDGAQTSV